MFKDKLKQLRKNKGLSQQELADKIFVSRSAICKWEMGNGVLSEPNLEELCKFFEVKEEWLFDRQDLKEGLKITKRNRNVNIYNIILIAINIIYLILIFTKLINTKIFVPTEGIQIQLWQVFNIVELLIIITSFFFSIGVGILVIMNNNGLLTLNISDLKRKKILNFGLVMSTIIVILFYLFTIIRMGHAEDYKNSYSLHHIIQEIILVLVIFITVSTYFMSENKIKKMEFIISVISIIPFLLVISTFIYALLNYPGNVNSEPEGSWLAFTIGFILNAIFDVIAIIISTIALIFSKLNKFKNRYLIIINLVIISISVLTFIILILL